MQIFLHMSNICSKFAAVLIFKSNYVKRKQSDFNW